MNLANIPSVRLIQPDGSIITYEAVGTEPPAGGAPTLEVTLNYDRYTSPTVLKKREFTAYPFHTLKVGHSFDANPLTGETLENVASHVRASLAKYDKMLRRAGERTAVFRVKLKRTENCIRVWRDA